MAEPIITPSPTYDWRIINVMINLMSNTEADAHS